MTNFSDETMKIARDTAQSLGDRFLIEVERILNSAGLDQDCHSRCLVFGVALENMADNYIRGDKNTNSYKNLKRF